MGRFNCEWNEQQIGLNAAWPQAHFSVSAIIAGYPARCRVAPRNARSRDSHNGLIASEVEQQSSSGQLRRTTDVNKDNYTILNMNIRYQYKNWGNSRPFILDIAYPHFRNVKRPVAQTRHAHSLLFQAGKAFRESRLRARFGYPLMTCWNAPKGNGCCLRRNDEFTH